MNSCDSVLFRATRPVSYGQVVLHHLPWVLLSGIVLLAAFVLPLDIFSIRTCVFMRLTSYSCLSCGWTRGFVDMANGQWLHVFHDCPLAAMLYGLTAVVLAWNTTALLLGLRLERGPWLRLNGKRGMWIAATAGVMVMANWIYRLAMGLK